jgi:YVTN family beta-propeller protein
MASDAQDVAEPFAAPLHGTLLPTGQVLTPTAVPGSTFVTLNPGLSDLPDFVAGQAISEAMTPDHRLLAVLTSGYNNNYDAQGKIIPADSNEYVFLFDVSGGAAVQRQVLKVPDTYVGIAFGPDGKSLYVSGGGDDELHVYTLAAGAFVEASGSPIALGHTRGGNGLAQSAMAQGLAVTPDGKTAIVANRYNDSVTVIDLSTSTVVKEVDLRPGKSGGPSGTPGGEYPSAVAVVGSLAYVTSERDREIVIVDVSKPSSAAVAGRIPVEGNPNKMVVDAKGHALYVASDNADLVSVVDLTGRHKNQVTRTIATLAPAWVHAGKYKGASPNGLALSPDQRFLYVTNRGTNSVAMVELPSGSVVGLLPTAWYPSDVAVSADGTTLYVANLKSVPGPNPGNCLGYQTVPCPVAGSPVTFAPNEYIENLNKGGLGTLPLPRRAAVRDALTLQVAANDGFLGGEVGRDERLMNALRERVHHVIYIIKENRTYDQVLGDLGKGNGDASLAEFPRATTPNFHAAASGFVTLDNFHDTGEVSGNGWPWSTAARESDAGAKMLPVNYACSPEGGPSCAAGRGGSYDWEGTNRNVNVGLTGMARLAADPLSAGLDADTLPGTGNVAAPDGPDGELQQGYLWDAALRAGLTVRNYGFFVDLTRYRLEGTPYQAYQIPRARPPFTKTGTTPDPKQAYAANPELAPLTDPYFRGFDDAYPDYYREQEWESEFETYVANGNLPALSLVRFMADHTGSYGSAIDGVNTPEIQVADNDYAVGKLLEAVARSPYAGDTLVFVVEDDAQDGPDHVDAHRSTAFVVGPYVKQGAVVSHHYTTVNLLRTITDVLGIDHLGMFDAHQRPMTEVFDLGARSWTFKATPSGLLAGTQLPIPSSAFTAGLIPTHDASYWAARTAGLDFSAEDRVDPALYNRILWEGLMAGKAYPKARTQHNASYDP